MSKKLKISIGMSLKDGPFGGGNQFGHNLAKYLTDQGIEVIFNLHDTDIDIILLTEPRHTSGISAYTDSHIMTYLNQKPDTLVVHRINECDERKNTNNVNRILRRANLLADYTVFVSKWLQDLHISQGMTPKHRTVIHNGSDKQIFNSNGYTRWDGDEPLRLVTHHWGANWNKGFDVYQKLDVMLEDDAFRQEFSFTYIGNLPENFSFKNANYIPPRSGQELAQLLRENHVYVTASRNEPGSNHQNEGALCGLPLLYLKNASMPEYADGFGIGFTTDNFETCLYDMKNNYEYKVEKMSEYPFTSDRTSQLYYDLFMQLYTEKDTLLQDRRSLRKLIWYGKQTEILIRHGQLPRRIYHKLIG